MNKILTLVDLKSWESFHNVIGTFRSAQVFRCPVCHALTNHIEVRGKHKYSIAHPFPICLHREKEWHKELRGKLFLANKPHPKSYMEELKAEIGTLRSGVAHDIVGDADTKSIQQFPATRISVGDKGYD